MPRDVTQTLDPPKNRSGKSDAVTPDDLPTRAEVVAIMEATDDACRGAISLGASGLRVSEVLGVHVEQYDCATGVRTVDRQYQRIDGSTRSRCRSATSALDRPARLGAQRPRASDRATAGAGSCSAVASVSHGVATSSIRRCGALHSSAPASTSAPTFHSLRHWCASSMLAEGVPVTAVAGHLGDTVETLSRTYAHWLRHDWDVPAAALSRMLRPTLAVVEAV